MKRLITTTLIIAAFALFGSIGSTVFAGHNPAKISIDDSAACGETTFTATITNPDGTHKSNNMSLVVHADGETHDEPIPTDGDDVSITVGPFFGEDAGETETISYRIFGGGERDYDIPSWNGYGEEGFTADIVEHADEVGGYGWTLAGPDDENEFVTWEELEVDGCIERSAEITAPDSGEEVSGEVTFEAYLADDDADSISWAVREGTCDAGTNTVFGNVDGHSDDADIDQDDLTNQTFSFTGDMSGMTPGEYCFVYNPVEDSGEANIRETVEFTLKDTTAPLVTIESPNDEDVLSGTVEIHGTVEDDHLLSHYNISVYPGDADFTDFSERIAQETVSLTEGFEDKLIFEWDSTDSDDGEYLIRLAARDAAGNRDLSGDSSEGGDDSQHVITITVENDTPDPVAEAPTNKNDCKKGGWKDFSDPEFKNQGQCVSFVMSNGNSRHHR